MDKRDNSVFSTKYNKIFRYEELPRYSPNLNPVEYLNNEFKNYLKKFVCKNEDDLQKRMDDFGSLFIDENGFASIEGKRKARKYFRCKECSFIRKAFINALLEIREERRSENIIERIKSFHILDKTA